jgi:hypothetical protein
MAQKPFDSLRRYPTNPHCTSPEIAPSKERNLRSASRYFGRD